jgi:formamidase
MRVDGGLGGLNKTPDGVVIGLVQLQLPTIATKSDLAAQTDKICAMVQKARKGMSTMDLVVFPEYSLHGLSMDTNPDLMSRLDGPEVASFRQACIDNRIWGCFSIMEYNPDGNPYNSGLIIDDDGEIKLYYRKMHPWVPVEPWEPGNLGIPVCDGPNGSKVALIICHDGMFPEMARECAYKGANIMLRTATRRRSATPGTSATRATPSPTLCLPPTSAWPAPTACSTPWAKA